MNRAKPWTGTMTEELRLWSVGESWKVEPLSPLQRMPAALAFEELFVRNRQMREPGLKLVGRQTLTQTGRLVLGLEWEA